MSTMGSALSKDTQWGDGMNMPRGWGPLYERIHSGAMG